MNDRVSMGALKPLIHIGWIIGPVLLMAGPLWACLTLPVFSIPPVISIRGNVPNLINAAVAMFATIGGGVLLRMFRAGRTRIFTWFACAIGFLGGAVGCGIVVAVREAPAWPAVLLASIAVLCATVSLLISWSRKAFLAHAATTTGTLMTIHLGSWESTKPEFAKSKYRMEFTDAQNRMLQVNGVGYFRHLWEPEDGGRVTVHFDPGRPRRHVLEMANGDLTG